jgi:peptidoglycan/xylan/chitin deacetylase (PgdA/CDA1 family)
MLRKWLEPGLKGLFEVLDFCGGFEYAQPWLGGMGLILECHRVPTRVTPVFDPGLAIYSDNLDRILAYIRRRGWDIIGINQLNDRLSKGPQRPPFVCFTFDDGYADNFTVALPIFRRHQAPFCINVTVGYVNRSTPGWWVALGEMILRRNEIEFCGPGRTERVKLDTWEEKVAAYQRLGLVLYQDVLGKRSPLENTWRANGIDPQALSDRYFLTWKQLYELAKDPLVQIGAHTLTHPSLSQLEENEAGDEIERSRRVLEEKLGVEVEYFAYPFGSRDNCGQREFRLVKELGFKTAVTTRWCNIFPAHKDHLVSLPRKHFMSPDVTESNVRASLYGEDLSFKIWNRGALD